MAQPELISDLLMAAIGIAAAAALVKPLHMGSALARLNVTIGKAFKVLGAQNVSDFSKERVLPHYARGILIGSGHLAICLLAVLGAFGLGVAVAQLILFENLSGVVDRVSSWRFQSVAAVLSMAFYLILWRRRP